MQFCLTKKYTYQLSHVYSFCLREDVMLIHIIFLRLNNIMYLLLKNKLIIADKYIWLNILSGIFFFIFTYCRNVGQMMYAAKNPLNCEHKFLSCICNYGILTISDTAYQTKSKPNMFWQIHATKQSLNSACLSTYTATKQHQMHVLNMPTLNMYRRTTMLGWECYQTHPKRCMMFRAFNGRLEDIVFTSNPSSSWQGIAFGLELL